jgi:hypothetical protein
MIGPAMVLSSKATTNGSDVPAAGVPMGGLCWAVQALRAWRAALAARIGAYRDWLGENDLEDAQASLKLARLAEQLMEDRLVVAIVAQDSNDKSELINAIFFGNNEAWRLPAGCVPLCPTEVRHDKDKPACIELLPIETSIAKASSAEFRRYPDEWRVFPLDTGSPEAMASGLARLGETRRVTPDQAARYGLFDPNEHQTGRRDAMVEISCWRYAVINLPHSLLELGLVILDTPDVKTMGAEAVLTRSLLDSAHCVVIVLRPDTDFAAGDTALWSTCIANTPGGVERRLAVLTITDGLWDERRPEAEIESQLGAQRSACAGILALPPTRVFAVSLQAARRARVSGDSALLERSRLPELERALANDLIAARHSIVAALARAEFDDLAASLRARLETRRRGVLDQLQELEYLRGKNRGLIASMTQKIRSDRENFEQGLARFQALRVVFSAHTDRLYTHLDLDAIAEDWQRSRKAILRASFTSGMHSAMSRHFREARSRLERSAVEVSGITELMTVMYRKFSQEHGLRLTDPVQFSMQRYFKEIDRIEATYAHHINTPMTMLTNDRPALMQRYFETLAAQVVRCYEYANREVDVWLRAIMAPMETQVREHQLQIRRRLESIKRIHEATDTLEQRIGELAPIERTLFEQLGSLARFNSEFAAALEFGSHDSRGCAGGAPLGALKTAAAQGASPFSAPSPSGADTSAATPRGSRGAPD